MTDNNESLKSLDDKNLAAKGEAEPAPEPTSGANQAKTPPLRAKARLRVNSANLRIFGSNF